MNEKDLHWLAGLLEGEGLFLKGPSSAPHQPRISLAMSDEDIVARVSGLLRVKYHPSGTARCAEKAGLQLFRLLEGSKAASLMQQLQPLMGRRRQAQIEAARACYLAVPHPTTRLIQNRLLPSNKV